jgi:hypothetical protein
MPETRYFLLVPNVDDDDVSLYQFASLTLALQFIEEIVKDDEFQLTNIVEQTGVINGWEPEDFEVITESWFK